MKRPTPKIQIFQTWNPHSLPHSSKILKESKFERPLVKTDSLKLLPKLQEIHNRSNNQIWFCGTYSLPGIPLLEAGAKSALLIAQKITNQKETEFLKGI
jgi:predicted NAD/FAD-binding protein